MNTRNGPAFPNTGGECHSGLTKREYAAIQIMAGFGADNSWDGTHISVIAKYAVERADAIFTELSRAQS